MTLIQARNFARQRHRTLAHTPRLRLKPKASNGGYVDGAWWPRGDDLAAELPDLLAVLSFRLRAVDRVTYNRDEWADAPARLVTGQRAVQLDANPLQPPDTLEVQDSNRKKVVLLVVPPHTEPDHAHAIVTTAAAADDASSVDALLTISEQDRANRTRAAAAEQRWDQES